MSSNKVFYDLKENFSDENIEEFIIKMGVQNTPKSQWKGIAEEYLKSHSTKRVGGLFTRPQFIKYVRELGSDFTMEQFSHYKEWRANSKAKDSSSLSFFIAKFGDKLGRDKFEEYGVKRATSLDSFIEKHGAEEGKRLWEELKAQRMITFDNFVEKYGEEEGARQYYSKNAKHSHSIKNTTKDMVWKVGGSSYKSWLRSINAKVLRLADDEARRHQYYRDVWRMTRKQPLSLLPNFDKRGPTNDSSCFAIDHKISIDFGFKNGIPAEQIANINNLQMLPHPINSSKNDKCFSHLDYCHRGWFDDTIIDQYYQEPRK